MTFVFAVSRGGGGGGNSSLVIEPFFKALIEFTIVNYCTRRKMHESSKNKYSLAAQARRMAEKQVGELAKSARGSSSLQLEINRYKAEANMLLMPPNDLADRNGGFADAHSMRSRTNSADPEKGSQFFRRNNSACGDGAGGAGFGMGFLPGMSKQAATRKYKQEQR